MAAWPGAGRGAARRPQQARWPAQAGAHHAQGDHTRRGCGAGSPAPAPAGQVARSGRPGRGRGAGGEVGGRLVRGQSASSFGSGSPTTRWPMWRRPRPPGGGWGAHAHTTTHRASKHAEALCGEAQEHPRSGAEGPPTRTATSPTRHTPSAGSGKGRRGAGRRRRGTRGHVQSQRARGGPRIWAVRRCERRRRGGPRRGNGRPGAAPRPPLLGPRRPRGQVRWGHVELALGEGRPERGAAGPTRPARRRAPARTPRRRAVGPHHLTRGVGGRG